MLTNEHERIQDRFFSLLDGSLSVDERQEVESHVATCPPCAEELRVTRETSALVAALPQRELPQGFCDRFFARLATQGPSLEDERVPFADCSPLRVDSGAGMAFQDPVTCIEADHQAGQRRAADTRLLALPSRSGASGRRLSVRLVSALAACLAVACGLALAWWSGRPSEPALAVLEWTSGAVRLQSGGDGRAHEVEQARTLRPGDVLETGADARSLVRLGATGSVRLDARTRIAVVALGTSDDGTFMKVQIERGALWVEDTSDARCVVQTREALIVPAGTVYDVRVTGETTQVNVWEGQVDFQAATRPRTPGSSGRLDAGQRAEVSPSSDTVRVGLVDVASRETDAWVRWNRSIHPTAPVVPRAPLTPPVPRSPSPPPWFATPPGPPNWGSPSSAAGSGSDPRISPDPHAGGSLPPRTTSPASATPPGRAAASPAGNQPPTRPVQGRPQVIDTTYPAPPPRNSSPWPSPTGTRQVPSHASPGSGPASRENPRERPRRPRAWPRHQGPQRDWYLPRRNGPQDGGGRDGGPRMRQRDRRSSTGEGGPGSISAPSSSASPPGPARALPAMDLPLGLGAWGDAHTSGRRSHGGSRQPRGTAGHPPRCSGRAESLAGAA